MASVSPRPSKTLCTGWIAFAAVMLGIAAVDLPVTRAIVVPGDELAAG